MCGRFTLATPAAELTRRFGIDGVPAGTTGRYNVAPSQQVLAVAAPGRAVAARWGLLPPEARSVTERVAPVNARAETVRDKRLFADLVGGPHGRVLVPADGWYEWLRAEDRRRPPQPFHHTVDGGAPFAFAGLLRTVGIGGEPVASVCVLTVPANRACAAVHDRMPAVLADRDREAAWLSGEVDAEAAVALCVPLGDGRVSARPVDAAVNRSGAEGPQLLGDPVPTTLF